MKMKKFLFHRTDRWDVSNIAWVKSDSAAEQWENDGLVKYNEGFIWNEGSSSWELNERRRIERIRNSDGLISEENESVWDIAGQKWIPVSRSLSTYGNEGNLISRSIRFWLASEGGVV